MISSCTKDMVNPEPLICDDSVIFTYDVQVKTIIDKTCAYAGCHVQGFSFGDYTTFEGLEPFLSNKFEARVINAQRSPQSMPPSYATGPDTLTTEEFRILRCWMKGGFLEAQ